MLKISIVEGRRQRRLVVEGKLIPPWIAELKVACERAKADLDGRDLVLDLRNLTVISHGGGNVLLDLMNDGIKFRCGVFAKHVLSQLARSKQQELREIEAHQEE